ESVHRVGFPPRGATALRTGAGVERRRFTERVAAAVGYEVFRQHDGKLLVRHRHFAAGCAVDERDRAAPIPLPRDAPVAQPVLHPLLAEAALLETHGDRLHGGAELEPGELP